MHFIRDILGHTLIFHHEVFRPCVRLPGRSGQHSHSPSPQGNPQCLAGLALASLGDTLGAPLLLGTGPHISFLREPRWGISGSEPRACLTRGHLALAGFVLFILVNRAVYFHFLLLGALAQLASLLFTLCKHLGLSKYIYKVPGTRLFCVWYFNGL